MYWKGQRTFEKTFQRTKFFHLNQAPEPQRLVVHVGVVVVQPEVVADLVRHDVDRRETAGGVRPPVPGTQFSRKK